ncbi:MAG: ABC transporter ATP-binding protein [Clostridia bacterium]
MSYIEIRDVVKSFGNNTVLKNIDLNVEQGEMVTLLGPSGCGKSTLLRAVAGLNSVDSGSVWIDGKDVTAIDARRRQVGMVFQSYALFPNMTAAQNVAFGLSIQRQDQKTIAAKVAEMIALVGLQGKENQRPNQLSGGQQQRVALARALIMQPKVLLLDEPLSALDAQIRQSLRVQIREIQQDMHITAIFVTHDQEEAMAISDRVCVMHNGIIEQQGTPVDIYKNPQSDFVARFIGHYNVFTPQEAGKLLGITPFDCKVVAIRPEAFTFEHGQNKQSITGKVQRISMLGSVTRYGMDCGGIEMNVEIVNHDARYLELGEQVTMYINEKNILQIAQ